MRCTGTSTSLHKPTTRLQSSDTRAEGHHSAGAQLPCQQPRQRDRSEQHSTMLQAARRTALHLARGLSLHVLLHQRHLPTAECRGVGAGAQQRLEAAGVVRQQLLHQGVPALGGGGGCGGRGSSMGRVRHLCVARTARLCSGTCCQPMVLAFMGQSNAPCWQLLTCC